MNVNRISRTTTRRTVTTLAAVLVATASLAACGGSQSPAPQQTIAPGLNKMEHEAHRQLDTLRDEQSRALNPSEHEAHRNAEETAPEVKAYEHRAQAPRG